MNNNSLRMGLLRIFFANIISLFFSLLTSFFLPKFLSVDSYAGIKTYQLYITYIGILHFGYEDGLYLKYGGKKIDEIDIEDLSNNKYTLTVFQMVISAIMLVVSIFAKDYILLAFSFSIVPVNLIACYMLIFQSVGAFDRYSKIKNWTSIVTFVINILLVYLIRTDNHLIFILLYVIWDIVLWIILEIYIKKILYTNKVQCKFSFVEMRENIHKGLPLTLGNFSSVLLTSIDRWFVKLFMLTVDFAQYSFAVSMENFINVALTPITITLYNYFCSHKDSKDIIKIRNTVLIFSSFVISCAFGAKLVIQLVLEEYVGAISVMFVLFSSQICYVVIKGVYVNVYKSQGKQNLYFKRLIIVVVFGIVANVVFYQINHTKESYAFATLFSAIFWLALCLIDYKELPMSIQEWIYLICSITSFNLCGVFLNPIAGFFMYIIILVAIGKLMIPKAQKQFIAIAGVYLNSLKKKVIH